MRTFHGPGGFGAQKALVTVTGPLLFALSLLGPVAALLGGLVEADNFFFEVLVLRGVSLIAPGLLLAVIGGVTLLQGQLGGLDCQDVVNDLIQKTPVVAGDDVALLFVAEVIGNDRPGRGIEVVGRFVQ